MAERFAALLRGVNVGGTGKVPMTELVALFESLGHREVESYIQSGNVVFASAEADPGGVASALEAAIADRFGLETRVLLRRHGELLGIRDASPFEDAVHVVFLVSAPDAAAVAALDHDRSPGDRLEVAGREVYLSLASGAGRTKLTLDWLERRLGVAGTQRNWNTLVRLVELTAPPAGG
jgi:uncharacterized protein (DUF1697 family)